MNPITRGIRNAFRNGIRTLAIVVIIGLSIGLSLTMLLAHQAVGEKIKTVKSSIGNTISIAPAGAQGFEGGGNPLTTSQLDGVKNIAHVISLDESVNDRLTTDNSSLQSAVDAGSLGRRFRGGGEGGVMMFGGNGAQQSFTPPVLTMGTTNTTKLGGNNITLSSGAQIDGSKDTNTALIGKSLADKNNLKVGSTFTAYNTTITVAGIYDTGTAFANNQVIFALPTLQRLSGQTADVTSATVTVDSISNMDSVVSSVKSKLGSSADITSSKDSAAAATAPLESIQKVSLYSLIGAVVAGGVIILLSMVMIVRERKREIGVVKAIGGSNARIMTQFMSEALTLTIMGALVGLIIGIAGSNPVTKTLVNNSDSNTSVTINGSPGMGGQTRVNINGQDVVPRGFGRRLEQTGPVRNLRDIRARVGWSTPLYGLGAALLLAVIGSVVAAGLTAKIRPAEVMRAD